jgi:hypothetical protein
VRNGPPADADAIEAQAFLRGGQRKLLLVNQRNRDIVVELPKECAGATMETIGGTSPDPVKQFVGHTTIRLMPFAVSVVTLKD